MSAILAEASVLVAAGERAGNALWAVTEALLEAGFIVGGAAVDHFEAMLEQGTDKPGEDTALFIANARKSIPIAMISRERREQISRQASDAWAAYVRAGLDAEKAEVVDFRQRERAEAAS